MIARAQLLISNTRELETNLEGQYDPTLKKINGYLDRADRELAAYAERKYGVKRETLDKYANKGK